MTKDLRSSIETALKQAMRDKDAMRLGTLRLINAAIKDQDIALRESGGSVGASEILVILDKMVKQRQESVRAYEEAGRMELAEREQAEITVIQEYLPNQLDEAQTTAAIDAAIAEIGADSIRDMGKVIGALKSKYRGQMDFAVVGPMVKDRLG